MSTDVTAAPPRGIGPAHAPQHHRGRVALVSVIVVGLLLWLLAQITDDLRIAPTPVLFTLLLNMALATDRLTAANAEDGISLRVIFWFFGVLFLGFVPIAQYLTGQWIFPVSERSMLLANLIILLHMALFGPAYRFGRGRAARKADVESLRLARISVHRLAVAGVLACVFVGALIARSGLLLSTSLLTRGDFAQGMQVLDYSVRPGIFFLFLFGVLYLHLRGSRRSAADYVAVALTAGAGILLNLPTATARFYVFSTYLGAFIVLFPPNGRRAAVYLLLLFAGLPAAYVANVVRALAAGVPVAESSSFVLSFFSGNFDAYEQFVHGLDFVRDHGPVWGHQLLGAIFFWVPRALWPGKPVGTGAFVLESYVSKTADVWYTNLSAPMIEEAYVNFALPGVVLASVIVGAACGYADRRYRQHLQWISEAVAWKGGMVLRARQVRFAILYPVLVGLFLYGLRGDLLSTTAYGTGITIGFLISQFLLVRPLVKSETQPAPVVTPDALPEPAP